jgi:hypothetical protein
VVVNTVPTPLPNGATAQPCNASTKWKSVTPDSEALPAPSVVVQVWPLSVVRAIVPRSEISQPTLPSRGTAAGTRAPCRSRRRPRSCRRRRFAPSCRRWRSPGLAAVEEPDAVDGRLGDAAGVAQVPGRAAVGAEPGAARRIGEDEALRGEGAESAQEGHSRRQRHACQVAPLSWVRCTRLSLTAMTVVASARRQVNAAPFAGGCTVCHDAPRRR